MKRLIATTVTEATPYLKQLNWNKVSFDVETLDTKWYNRWCHGGAYEAGQPTGISFCDGDIAVYVDTCGWTLEEAALLFNQVPWKEIKEVIAHNLPFDVGCVRKYGVRLPEDTLLVCSMTAAHLLDENRPKSLKFLAKHILGEEETVPWTEARHTKEIFQKYALDDAIWTWELMWRFEQELEHQGLTDLFYNIECPFQKCLIEMEETGVLIDLERVHKTAEELQQALVEKEIELLEFLGEPYETLDEPGPTQIDSPINFNSSQQLGEVLFDRLGLEVIETTRTGKRSTGAATLRAHKAHPFVKILKQYKIIQKLLSAFFNPLPSLTDPDGKIRPNFRNTGTVTGRLSCASPNLQQLPSVNDTFPVETRDCFIAPEGYKMIACDFSQQESRVMADLSGDQNLIKLIREGGDIHLFSANNVFGLGIPEEKLFDNHPEHESVKEQYKTERNKGKCFHPDTEVLTPNEGWKRIIDLYPEQEVLQAIPKNGGVDFEWVQPLEVFTQYHDSGKLIHLQNYGINLRVTPDHRMLSFKKDGTHYVSFPNSFNKSRYWVNAGRLQGNKNLDPTLLRLAVAAQADGSFVPEPSSAIRFGFTKQRKINRMDKLLLSYLGDFSKTKRKDGSTHYYIKDPLASRIRDLLTVNKEIPISWLHLSESLRKLIIEECIHWDGHNSRSEKRNLYFSTSKISADAIQAIALSVGKKSKMWYSRAWYVSIKERWHTRGGNVSVTEIPFTGKVACLSVPSSFVLVRDKGIPVVTGQTFSFGIPYGMSEHKAAKDFGVSIEEGKRLMDNFFKGFPDLDHAIKLTHKEAEKNLYVSTYTGRRRRFQKNKWGRLDSRDLRQSFNFLIQSLGADLVRKAHIALYEYARKHPYMGIKQIMSVHDEVVFLVKEEYAQHIAHDIEKMFEGVWELCVPLKAKASIGNTYGEVK